MKSVLISIRPKWCEKIISGEKTIEVRKTRPKMKPLFKCYIYQTGKGGVIGEFVCDEIFDLPWGARIPSDIARGACLEPGEIHQYLGVSSGYGWHISNLKIYDAPLALSEFIGLRTEPGSLELRVLERPPQSWCYVGERTMYDVSLRSFGKTVFLHEAAEKALAEMEDKT